MEQTTYIDMQIQHLELAISALRLSKASRGLNRHNHVSRAFTHVDSGHFSLKLFRTHLSDLYADESHEAYLDKDHNFLYREKSE